MQLKVVVVVALCALAMAECKPSEHNRVVRQQPLVDVNGLPLESTLGMVTNLDALGLVQQVGAGAVPGVLDAAQLSQLPIVQG